MSRGAPDAVSWFVQTAGAASDQGYRWLAVTLGEDTREPAQLMQSEVAGRSVASFLSDSALSVVLGTHDDGRSVLVVSGLRPEGAPPKGDHMHRPIRATLVGVVPAGGDVAPLLGAAASAMGGTLADALPVVWTDDGPVAGPAAASWRPPATRPSGSPPAVTAMRLSAPRDSAAGDGAATDSTASDGAPGDGITLDSVAVPDTDEDRLRVASEMTTLAAADLRGFADERPLFVATPMLDREDLTALRPWRAVTSSVRQRTTLAKEGRSRTGRSCGEIVAAVLGLTLGLAVVAWAVLHHVVGR